VKYLTAGQQRGTEKVENIERGQKSIRGVGYFQFNLKGEVLAQEKRGKSSAPFEKRKTDKDPRVRQPGERERKEKNQHQPRQKFQTCG